MAPAVTSPVSSASRTDRIDRNKFEDEFPVMYKFYLERGRLNETQLQKVQEIQQRWKSGYVFWLTHDNQEIEIPEWVAVNVVVNNKHNLVRGSRICMSLNHTKGYGCNRLAEGMCNYVHECALCGQLDHGVFQKRANGTYICLRLRGWYDEESRYKGLGFGDPRKHEDSLTDLAKQPRAPAPRPQRRSDPNSPSVWDSPNLVSPSQRQQKDNDNTAAGTDEVPEQKMSVENVEQETRVGRVNSSQQSTSACSTNSSAQVCTASAIQATLRSGPPTEPPPPQRSAPAANRKASADSAGEECLVTKTGSNKRVQSSSSVCSSNAIKVQQASVVATAAAVPRCSPPVEPPPPQLPADWQALWCSKNKAYYYWHVPSNTTVWDVPKVEHGCATSMPAAQQEDGGRQVATSLTDNGHETGKSQQESVKICTEHWRPPPDNSTCLRIFKGERLIVCWTENSNGGWAFGHVADDPSQSGYFPQAVLAEPRRAPQQRATGEVCIATEAFDAPEEVGGYLGVSPGDALRLLFPTDINSAWAYVEKIHFNSDTQVRSNGWVPESLLRGQNDMDNDDESGLSRHS